MSADRRFAIAYNAALQAANMAIACAGIASPARRAINKIAFKTTRLVLGQTADKYADYFEACRRKRNTIDYTHSRVATETEAKEIPRKAAEFCELVETWIARIHPELKR